MGIGCDNDGDDNDTKINNDDTSNINNDNGCVNCVIRFDL